MDIDLLKIAESFNKWLNETAKELEIDPDTIQEIVHDLLN